MLAPRARRTCWSRESGEAAGCDAQGWGKRLLNGRVRVQELVLTRCGTAQRIRRLVASPATLSVHVSVRGATMHIWWRQKVFEAGESRPRAHCASLRRLRQRRPSRRSPLCSSRLCRAMTTRLTTARAHVCKSVPAPAPASMVTERARQCYRGAKRTRGRKVKLLLTQVRRGFSDGAFRGDLASSSSARASEHSQTEGSVAYRVWASTSLQERASDRQTRSEWLHALACVQS